MLPSHQRQVHFRCASKGAPVLAPFGHSPHSLVSLRNSEQEESKQQDESIAQLEKRIDALEVGATYDATKAEVQKVEKEFLVKLREIRSAIDSAEGGIAVSATSNAEVEKLKAESKALKDRNAKLEYRIKHMLAEMERMYERRKSSGQGSTAESDVAEF